MPTQSKWSNHPEHSEAWFRDVLSAARKVVAPKELKPDFVYDSRFLELEAKQGMPVLDAALAYVRLEPLSAKAEAQEREVVPALAKAFMASVKQADIEGQCFLVSMLYAQMLSLLGIAGVCFVGNLIAQDKLGNFVKMSTREHPDGPGMDPGHAWVSTACFPVVDLTLRHQKNEKGFLRTSPDLPDYVVGGELLFTPRSLDDFVPLGTTVRRLQTEFRIMGIRANPAAMAREDMRYLPIGGWQQYRTDKVLVEYLPCAIKMASEGLEKAELQFDEGPASEFLERFIKALPSGL